MNFIPSRYENLPSNTKSVLALLQSSDEEKEDNEIKEVNGKEQLHSSSKCVYTVWDKTTWYVLIGF